MSIFLTIVGTLVVAFPVAYYLGNTFGFNAGLEEGQERDEALSQQEREEAFEHGRQTAYAEVQDARRAAGKKAWQTRTGT